MLETLCHNIDCLCITSYDVIPYQTMSRNKTVALYSCWVHCDVTMIELN